MYSTPLKTVVWSRCTYKATQCTRVSMKEFILWDYKPYIAIHLVLVQRMTSVGYQYLFPFSTLLDGHQRDSSKAGKIEDRNDDTLCTK